METFSDYNDKKESNFDPMKICVGICLPFQPSNHEVKNNYYIVATPNVSEKDGQMTFYTDKSLMQ